MNTRKFPLTAVLTAYTGYVFGPMSELYQIVDFVLDAGGISTIGLLDAVKPIKEALLEQHPSLGTLPVPNIDSKTESQEAVEVKIKLYLNDARALLGDELECVQVGWGNERRRDDYEIIRGVRGNTDNVITVVPVNVTESGE